MVKTTKALRKIAGLTKRIKVIQGGQGAGKTFAILILLINYASGNEGKDIYIASAELSKMRTTVVKDAITILRAFGLYEKVECTGIKNGRPVIYFPNNSVITFIGLDKEDIGKGLRSDVIFLNEANKTSFETYRELTSRAKQVFIDFNPNNEFWAHKEVLNRDDAQFLILTYKDNEHLAKTEIKEIELNRERAYINPELENPDKPENVKSKYYQNKWHVYGLGKVGSNPNRIFFWDSVEVEQYNNITGVTYYGVDWGAVDPMAIVEVKYYDGAIYIKELNYKSENQIRESLTSEQNKMLNQDDEGLVKWLFSRLNIDKSKPVVCDSNRPNKISALRDMGWDYAISAGAVKVKGSILDGVDIINGLQVFYTRDSKNIEMEQKNYSRKEDRFGVVLEEPADEYNHLMDAIRYVVLIMRREGVIKSI